MTKALRITFAFLWLRVVSRRLFTANCITTVVHARVITRARARVKFMKSHGICAFSARIAKAANAESFRPAREEFLLPARGATPRESNLNISLVPPHTRVRSIDVPNVLRNFNRRHGSRDTIRIPYTGRKHRSRKLYINDLQRAENSDAPSHLLRRTLPYFRPALLVSFGTLRRPSRRILSHYVGSSSCIRRNGA